MTSDFTPAAAGDENFEYLDFLNLEFSDHLILAQKLGCTFAGDEREAVTAEATSPQKEA